MPDENLNYRNKEARAELCRQLMDFAQDNGISEEQLVEQLKTAKVPPSWATLLVYNAQSEAA